MQCQMHIIYLDHIGGLGIEENIVTLCNKCHHDFDNGSRRVEYGYRIQWYLKSIYGDNWNERKLIYNKYN